MSSISRSELLKSRKWKKEISWQLLAAHRTRETTDSLAAGGGGGQSGLWLAASMWLLHGGNLLRASTCTHTHCWGERPCRGLSEAALIKMVKKNGRKSKETKDQTVESERRPKSVLFPRGFSTFRSAVTDANLPGGLIK